MKPLALILALLPVPLAAETLVATRVLRAQSVIGPADVTQQPGRVAGALALPAEALGKEARVTLYPGRPIRAADLGPPALVERNQLVALRFRQGNLDILTEARALGRGGEGEVIRVMNLQSRTTVSARVAADGSVSVPPHSP